MNDLQKIHMQVEYLEKKVDKILDWVESQKHASRVCDHEDLEFGTYLGLRVAKCKACDTFFRYQGETHQYVPICDSRDPSK